MRTVIGFAVLIALLAGCKGIPTKGEKEARHQLQDTAANYRPDGRKPTLPVLTANSSLGDFLTYAMLNQPNVEAAYYDWAGFGRAHHHRAVLPRPAVHLPDGHPECRHLDHARADGEHSLAEQAPGRAAEVASAESRAKYFTFQSAVLESAFAVKRAYYQLYFLAEKIRVNRETLGLLTELEKPGASPERSRQSHFARRAARPDRAGPAPDRNRQPGGLAQSARGPVQSGVGLES